MKILLGIYGALFVGSLLSYVAPVHMTLHKPDLRVLPLYDLDAAASSLILEKTRQVDLRSVLTPSQ